jgi:exodeoxyribonuclease VII large subunit
LTPSNGRAPWTNDPIFDRIVAMKPIRVSQINAYIKRLLQSDPILSNISIVGEISNYRPHSSGHVYFSLKDPGGRLSCFLPSDIFRKIRAELRDGMMIVATGYIYVFEKGGTYSLNVREITAYGEGDMSAAFEALKAKLAAEGLFDDERKRPIPAFPKKIGIVTSGTGAALQDIIKIISARNDYVSLVVCPVQVQGIGAAQEIADGIRLLNRLHDDADCIIVGRGGGSAEELWAFNEEAVARSIYESAIPVISAVGHQTDFTIADFVADKRAETPSAAAHLAAPDMSLVRERLTDLRDELRRDLLAKTEKMELRLKSMDKSRLSSTLSHRLDRAAWQSSSFLAEMEKWLGTKFGATESKLRLLEADLSALNPKALLNRGYSIIEDENGSLVTSIRRLREGATVKATLADGAATLTVNSLER